MRKYVFLTIVLLLSCVMYGQITTDEKPISFTIDVHDLVKSENTNKSLPSLNMEAIEKEDVEDESNGRPPRFGFPHEVNFNLYSSGEWTDIQEIMENQDLVR